MSTERAKGCWRGLNAGEQIKAALRDGRELGNGIGVVEFHDNGLCVRLQNESRNLSFVK